MLMEKVLARAHMCQCLQSYQKKSMHDAGLNWPFVGEVTVTLLNQLQDMNHHSMVISFNATNNSNVGDALGFPTYIPHSSLSHRYLHDDALYFRVSVEVTDYKHWLE